MADDRLTAELEAIRERSAATKGSAHGYVPRGERLPGGPCGEWLIANLESASDVPRLLAALDAVLKDHQPGRIVIFGALCKRHENHGYFSITSVEAADVRDCGDCDAAVYSSCTGCGPQADIKWCPVRKAITRALTGEEREAGARDL